MAFSFAVPGLYCVTVNASDGDENTTLAVDSSFPNAVCILRSGLGIFQSTTEYKFVSDVSKAKAMGPSTFTGKCLTILTGLGLSWLTVTNPDMDRLAASLLGKPTVQTEGFTPAAAGIPENESKSGIEVQFEPGVDIQPSVEVQLTGPEPTPQEADVDAHAAIAHSPSSFFPASPLPSDASLTTRPPASSGVTPVLRSSDARIEEISSELKRLGASYLVLERLAGTGANHFRARCDLAREQATVRCSFEATRESALAAMEEVLGVVRHNLSADRTLAQNDRKGTDLHAPGMAPHPSVH